MGARRAGVRGWRERHISQDETTLPQREQRVEGPPKVIVPRRRSLTGVGRALRGPAALIAASFIVVNLGNYLFQLIAARTLSSSDFSALASLLVVVTLVTLPFSTTQTTVARYVAEYDAQGRRSLAGVFVRRGLWVSIAAAGLVLVAGLAASVPIAHLMRIDSNLAVALGAVLVTTAVPLPVLLGALQGRRRFGWFATAFASAGVMRPLFFVILLALGLGLVGGMTAGILSGIGGLAVCYYAVRRDLRVAGSEGELPDFAEPLRHLGPVVIAQLSFASLTNIDLVVVKGALPDEIAADFAGAGLIAKLLLYLPTIVATLLVPSVARRTALGVSSERVLGRSLLVVAAFSAVGCTLLAIAPTTILWLAYGDGFSAAASYLPWYGLIMAAFAAVNILMFYELSGNRHTGYTAFMGGIAVAHALALVLFHATITEVLIVDGIAAIVALAGYEVLFGGAIRAVRSAVPDHRRGPVATEVTPPPP